MSDPHLADSTPYPPAGQATTDVIQSTRGFQATVALSTGAKNFVLMKDRLAPFRQARLDFSCHYELAWRPAGGGTEGRHDVLVRVAGMRKSPGRPVSITILTASASGRG